MTVTHTNFPLYEIETAPEASKPILEAAKEGFGMVPNLHKALAAAPAALEGYATLWNVFDKSSFTPVERQIVYLTSNYENECRYCMAGHSVLAKGAGVPADAIEAIREGAPIADAKLQALRAFTAKVVVNRGWVSQDDVQTFLDAGYDRANVFEVILGVAVKVISNYANHVAETPLDDFMGDTVWTPPAKRERAA